MQFPYAENQVPTPLSQIAGLELPYFLLNSTQIILEKKPTILKETYLMCREIA
jgi:hypothetical protein